MKRILSCILTVLLIPVLFSLTVNADIGPKPSVNVDFIGMTDDVCYVTLMSEVRSTGPFSVWDGETENYSGIDDGIWKKFVEYSDPDGFYFLQNVDKLELKNAKDGTMCASYVWGYYPPERFKIVIYYPEYDLFLQSGVFERYAFDSYYTVDMNGRSISSAEYDEARSNNDRIKAYKSFDIGAEFAALAARIALTVAAEIAVGLLFRIKEKRAVIIVAVTNVVTQILLNLILYGGVCFDWFSDIYVVYLLAELAVIAIEALVYCRLMKRDGLAGQKNSFFICYSIFANIASFRLGIILLLVIPSVL